MIGLMAVMEWLMQLCGRVFTRGAMGHWINILLWIHLAISFFSQHSMTGVKKKKVCVILSVE